MVVNRRRRFDFPEVVAILTFILAVTNSVPEQAPVAQERNIAATRFLTFAVRRTVTFPGAGGPEETLIVSEDDPPPWLPGPPPAGAVVALRPYEPALAAW